jgi:hypothetical protein
MYQLLYIEYVLPAWEEEDDGSCEHPKANYIEIQWIVSQDMYINSAIWRLLVEKITVERLGIWESPLWMQSPFWCPDLGIAHDHSRKRYDGHQWSIWGFVEPRSCLHPE